MFSSTLCIIIFHKEQRLTLTVQQKYKLTTFSEIIMSVYFRNVSLDSNELNYNQYEAIEQDYN